MRIHNYLEGPENQHYNYCHALSSLSNSSGKCPKNTRETFCIILDATIMTFSELERDKCGEHTIKGRNTMLRNTWYDLSINSLYWVLLGFSFETTTPKTATTIIPLSNPQRTTLKLTACSSLPANSGRDRRRPQVSVLPLSWVSLSTDHGTNSQGPHMCSLTS